MRAAVLREFGRPLEVANVPVPVPAADEALVKVVATGICGTDLKITSGAFSTTPLPIIPGHEVAGELAQGAARRPLHVRPLWRVQVVPRRAVESLSEIAPHRL